MTHTVNRNNELDIIEIVFKLDISREDLEKSTVDSLQLASANNLNLFLIDITEADLVAPLVDVFDLADKRYDELGANRKNRAAVISSNTEKNIKLAEFYEHVCMNRGWLVKTFQSRKEAVEWFQSSQPHSKYLELIR